jgi:predicted nucleic acid-binding protein
VQNGESTRIYFDADLLIAWFQDEDTTPLETREAVDQLIQRTVAGEFHIIASTILTPECASVKSQIDILFSNVNHVTRIDVDARIAELAREYVLVHRLKPHDAIHLATATATGCKALFTKDQRLLRVGQIEETVLTTP